MALVCIFLITYGLYNCRKVFIDHLSVLSSMFLLSRWKAFVGVFTLGLVLFFNSRNPEELKFLILKFLILICKCYKSPVFFFFFLNISSAFLSLKKSLLTPRSRGYSCIPPHPQLFFFFMFWLHLTGCRLLDPPPRIEPSPPAVETQSLNHWTAREVPSPIFFNMF